MRIAVWHNLPSGGGFRAMYDQVRGLVSRGHHVEIWCPEAAAPDSLPIDTLAPVHRVPLRLGSSTRDGSVWGASFGHLRFVRQALRALNEHVEVCAREIDRLTFDVVLAHPSKLFYMHPLARFTRTPCVLFLQEVYRPLHEARPSLPWEAFPGRPSRLGGFRHWRALLADVGRLQGDRVLLREERRAACEWDVILCNSLFSRESIVRAYGIDARVCYLGVDLAFFTPGAGPRTHFVGLGGLNWCKGARSAIRAISLLPPAFRRPLRWVGNFASPAYRRACEELAASLGVEFVCEVSVGDETLRARLQRAVALVYPSFLEPFGYAPLEANACGTPVVAIAEGGIRESVQDGVNGLLVDDRRPESLAGGLRRLMEDEHLAERLRLQAVAWVRERWSLDAAIARLEHELETVMARGRRTKPQQSLCEII